jgi:hypothetical protein
MLKKTMEIISIVSSFNNSFEILINKFNISFPISIFMSLLSFDGKNHNIFVFTAMFFRLFNIVSFSSLPKNKIKLKKIKTFS